MVVMLVAMMVIMLMLLFGIIVFVCGLCWCDCDHAVHVCVVVVGGVSVCDVVCDWWR